MKPDKPPAPQRIQYKRVLYTLDGNELVLTFMGAAGKVSVRIPADSLDRWGMKILRSQALT